MLLICGTPSDNFIINENKHVRIIHVVCTVGIKCTVLKVNAEGLQCHDICTGVEV